MDTRIDDVCGNARCGFAPHPWLKSPHAQTLWPLLASAPAPPPHQRLELSDGDFIDVGWYGEPGAGRPIAVLVHGLGGSLASPYMLRMAARLHAQGWCVAMLQLRGAGAEPNRLPQDYHHGDTEDFRWFCRQLRRREPRVPLVAVGWSLGANVVLKALGEDGAASPLDGAVAISAPFDLELCAEHLRSNAWFYQSMLLRSLKRRLLGKHRQLLLSQRADLQLALAAPDFFHFGDAYTAPVNGFADVRDYCRRTACGRYLRDIRRPAVVIQAMDDPVLGAACISAPCPASRHVDLRLFQHGGHAGFVTTAPNGAPQLWLERAVPEALAGMARLRRPASPRRSPRARGTAANARCRSGNPSARQFRHS